MLRATKIRIYPTPEQIEFLDRQFGAVRFVWNKALAIKTHRYRVHGEKLSAKRDLKPLLAVAKKSRKYGWLADFDGHSLQQACINLDRAFKNFFEKRARFPRFKRRHGAQSSYHCTGKIGFGADWVSIPKLPGRLRAVVHRMPVGRLTSITLTKTATGKYFASLLLDDGINAPELPAVIHQDDVIGVDVGLAHVAIDSDGRKTDNPQFVKRAQRNLRRKQKALSRKQKGSSNRAKARLIVAAAHERVANARGDFQHKLSRRLVDENQAIIVETLAVKNMLKNRKLARAISDAGWSSLLLKIAYKAERAGKHIVKLDRWAATSKTCSDCGEKADEMPLSVRSWTCCTCGSEHDRDVNAALNIKRLGILELRAGGLHVPACGGLRKTGHAPAAADEAGSKAARAA
jgi:putative transposase